MPHIIVEYSANLEGQLNIAVLLEKIHRSVLESGVFKLGAVRTRGERRDTYVIADGDPNNAFIHVELKIAPGRDAATRRSVAQAVLDTIAAETKEVFAHSGLGISVDVNEIDRTASLRLNNLHERLSTKGPPPKRAAS
jgi:5-carboxymethyl-2-hydroxymuconate isomerase